MSDQANSSRYSPVLATPAGFAEGVLGLELYDWQRRMLNELERPGMISLRCCNEAGKTTRVAAPAIAHVMALYPGAQVVVTSGSWRQVKEQLFPAFHRFRLRLPGWVVHDTTIRTPEGSRCVGFSTDDAGLFEGFHVGPAGHHENPLLIIVDEAKSVDETIFQAIDRCRPTWLMLMSSPGAATGRFYQSHTSQRSFYRTHVARASDCPHIDQQTITNIIARYGENHPFVRSSIYAEFDAEGGPGMVIALARIEDCHRAPPVALTGDRHAFCDFARHRDENVLAVREGNRVRIERAWRDTDTMRACGEYIAAFRRLNLKAEEITGDDDGLGAGVIDRMGELGWEINRFHGGQPAREKNRYANRISEVWGEGSNAIERRAVIIPEDTVLIEQLTCRAWKRYSDGTLQLESKDDMRRRGLRSPDRADAVLGAMAPVQEMLSPGALLRRQDPFARMATAEEEETQWAGANAGL